MTLRPFQSDATPELWGLEDEHKAIAYEPDFTLEQAQLLAWAHNELGAKSYKGAEAMFPELSALTIDWDHVYLLGWYGHDGKPYLTTWDGNLPYVNVVVTGCDHFNMPMWKAPVPKGAELHAIPEDKNPQEYAIEINGYHALGWYIADGFQRDDPASGNGGEEA